MNRAILALLTLPLAGCERAATRSPASDIVAEAIPGALVRTLIEEPHQGMKSAQAHDEASEVLQFITAHYSSTPQPKLYCSGGSISTHIDVYGVIQPAEQDRIGELVRAEFPKRNWKQVYFIFRDREHFTAQDNGWNKRDGEKQLYSTVVKQP